LIILSDMGADDNSRNRGRGKTIIANALSEVQKTMIKGGNEFDGGYRHRFADLDEAYKIYVIDDVPASFNFNDLYTNIVGDISVEPKGKASRTIEFKETPKFLITTNWVVRYDEKATSTNRRFIEFKLTILILTIRQKMYLSIPFLTTRILNNGMPFIISFLCAWFLTYSLDLKHLKTTKTMIILEPTFIMILYLVNLSGY